MPEKLLLKNICFSYQSNQILNQVFLKVTKGETVIISGRSGCGKSTFLDICSGILVPQEGEVFIDGENIQQMSQSGVASLRQKMGFVFQQNALISYLDSFENIALPMRYHSLL